MDNSKAFEVQGKYNSAKIFTDVCEETAISQIIELCNQPMAEKSRIRIMPDVHAGAGCTIGTTMTVTDKVVPNLVGVDIGCLDAETEFITESGFKKISEYQEGEKVLQYDPDTDTVVFVDPYAYINQPCEKFWHFKNSKGLDQMLSKEHRMLVFKGYKARGHERMVLHPEELASKNLSKGYYSFKAAYSSANKGLDMTDNQLRIRIALCADGRLRVSKTGVKSIEFHFSKERKIQRLQQLLDEEKIEYTNNTQTDGTTIFYFSSEKNNLDCYEKTMKDLYMANRHQLEVISNESLLWDGYDSGRIDHSYFSSTNKEFADFIQFAFSGCNIRAGMSVVHPKAENESDVYIVTPTKNEWVAYNEPPTIVEGKDMRKYCFVVPSSYFVIRRNGKIAITGNCGVEVVKCKETELDLEKLDKLIYDRIPSGFSKRGFAHPYAQQIDLKKLYCYDHIDENCAQLSIGTLGGGNHFVEVDRGSDDSIYVVIHSGSRHLGLQAANYYQNEAYNRLNGSSKAEIDALIKRLKIEGKEKQIEAEVKKLKNVKRTNIPKPLAYAEGELLEQYLHDIAIIQKFAALNRQAMMDEIVRGMGLTVTEQFTTIHNYIDVENMILRKGSVSAQKDEKLIIPINMRDGSLICIGKGNPDWNFSAPHGAGRLMSRGEAKKTIDLADFKKSMEGIYTTSVSAQTIDESPMVYKAIEDIVENVRDTVDIVEIIKPIYNFKAGEE